MKTKLSTHPVGNATLKKAGSSLFALFVLAGLWSRQINRCASGKRSTRTLFTMTLSISVALSLGIATPAFAAEKYWSWTSCGQTSFWDLNCWSATSGGALDGTAQPLDGDNVYIYNSNSFDLGVLYRNTAYPTATLNSLTINATGIGAMRLLYTYNDNLSTITEIVGDTGTGIVDQTTGTHSVTNSLILGNAATGSGFFNLSSTGTLSAGTIYVGNVGTGTLDIDTGGLVTNTTGYLGNASGSTGTATVSGTGSTWTNSNALFVGYAGTGVLSIDSGGLVTSTNGFLGFNPGGNGTATVDTGGTWTSSDSLFLGGLALAAGGTGVLNVNTGGNVNVTNLLKVWGGGTVNLAGGAITAGSFDSSLGTFNFTDGMLTVDGGTYNDGSANLNISGSGFSGGNPTLVLSNGASATYSGGGFSYVGNSDSGTLSINSGGLLTNVSLLTTVGWSTSGGDAGTVMVSGADVSTGTASTWDNSNHLVIGDFGGTGSLNIDSGGKVINVNGYLGSGSGSNGMATVSGVDAATGTASTWASSGDLYIGNGGTGSLNIDSGGKVINVNGYLGSGSGSNGMATVSGSGSIWDNSSNLYVGDFGTGTLNIETGGKVKNNEGILGLSSGDGTVMVNGSGSIWENVFQLFVGYSGTGSLNIDSGGKVTNTVGTLGRNIGGNGMATVSGAGSSWENSNSLYVGLSGAGILNIDSGGLVTSSSGEVSAGGGDGMVTVSDAGSRWDISSTLDVGVTGTGILNINNGGLVTNTDGVLGFNVGSNGTATVSGTGSTWTNSGDLFVGDSGTGTLNIDSGGLVTNTFGSLGQNSGSNGTATVSGSDATTGTPSTYSSTTLTVGLVGTGTLNIVNGGLVTGNWGYIGSGINGVGTATVSGSDAATGTPSTWATSTLFTVGHLGVGILNINNGGLVTTPVSVLGGGSASTGTATVSGVDAITGLPSTWTTSGNMYVGGDNFGAAGTSLLTVGTGGIVNVTNRLKIWGPGTVNLNGGIINTGSLDPLDGTFNFTAGALNLISSDLLVETGGILGSAITLPSVKALGVSGTTTLNGASTLTLDGGTFSTGSLVNNGGFIFNKGTFNLTGDNLTIGAGGLFGSIAQFGINQSVNVSNATTVDNGSVLSLANGTFTSGTTINNGIVDFDGPVSTLGGGTLTNNGLITGDGRITASLTNAASSEVRVLTGDMLSLTNVGNINQGAINLLGGAITFDQDLTNDTAGNIIGSGSLAVSGGLANQGTLALSGGTTSILGDVNNTTGGTIIISGNSTATFFDDVMHNGTEIRVSSGSSAVFFGAVSGAGSYTGTGSLFFEGDLNPGNSPGLVSIEGDMGLGMSSHTIMEVAGLDRGTAYDAFDIGGDLWLDGILEVSLYDTGDGLFDPQLGDSFDLFMADIITGEFDLLTLAALGGGLGWQMDVLADAMGLTDVVRLSVVASTVPVPPSVWLFGSGLLGLIAIARRRQAA